MTRSPTLLFTLFLALPALAAPDPKSPEAERAAMTVAPGYDVTLFASEADGVVKPIQMRWDDRGRLWVVCSPTYPQVEPGQKPNDKILVLEDTDGDGRCDKVVTFAEDLQIPTGIEIAGGDAVYVAHGTELLLLRDTDGDGKADSREVVLSGFGTGDGHQMINSLHWGPGGELWFSQGAHTFSNVETPFGVERLYSSGVWRLRPRTGRLDPMIDGRRGHPTNSWAGPANPWGFAFDHWGQLFCNDAAGNRGLSWIVPSLIRSDRHVPVQALWKTPKGCGMDIVGTAAWPDEAQGRLILGHYFTASVRQFGIADDRSGFSLTELPPLVTCADNAFRVVDVRFGPDGACYLCDWYNPVIGHYQASYRDPNRDRTHGRIWRLTAKGKPATKRPNLAAMSPAELLNQLESPDRWTVYQARRLLFQRKSDEVVAAADAFVAKLDPAAVGYEHRLYTTIGVFEAHEAVRPDLLAKLAAAKDFRARAYAARIVGHWFDRIDKPLDLLARLAADEHARVRVEAIVSASFVPDAKAIEVAAIAADRPVDPWVEHAMLRAVDAQKDRWRPAFLKGELAFDNKINRLSWVLRCDGSPETAGAVRRMLEGQTVAPADRSPLAVLLANVGTAEDLRFLFDRYGTDPAVLTELATVARSRNLVPPGDVAKATLGLLGHRDPAVRAAAARLAGAWRVKPAATVLRTIAVDASAGVPVRVAAVEALGDLQAATAPSLSPLLADAQPAEVRVAAVAALAATDRPAAAAAGAKLLASLEKDEQVAGVLAGFLSRQGGPEELAKAIGTAGLPPKSAQRALDAMHARGRGDPSLVDALNKAMGVSADTPPYNEALVKSLVDDSAKLGDASRGKALYQQKLTACAACHAINGQGGNLGPDLSGIGRGMTPELIVEAVLWPKRQVKEGYLSVSVVTKAGDDFTGYAESEDAAELRLKDVATGKVQRIPKPQIAKRTNAGTIMPDGLTATLKREELLDLLAFLRSLGRSVPIGPGTGR